jgi:predicted nucleotidyltransferase
MDKKIIEMIDFPDIFTKEQIDYIGQSVVREAQRVCGAKLRDVILYGSYARGDFMAWSDVDIMVLVDGSEIECKSFDNEITKSLYDLGYHMNLLLSVIVTPSGRFERMKPDYPFYANVDQEGVSLC